MSEHIVAVEPQVSGRSGDRPYVDWPAILAGALIAAAISFVLLSFGAALGLSLSAAFSGEGFAFSSYVIAIGLWFVWVQVSAVAAGAYLTGRLRHRVNDASQHEVEVRDGAHGVVVWALATIIGAWLAVSGVTGALRASADAAGSGISTIVSGVGAGSRAATTNPEEATRDATNVALDVLFRPGAVASGEAAPGAPAPGRQVVSTERRNEVLRLLASGVASGEIPESDKAYLAQVVSRETGVSTQEATARVETFIKARNEAVAKAREVAEQARKIAILLAFVTAVSLLLAAAAGWWAATAGGGHRDEETVIPLLTWRR